MFGGAWCFLRSFNVICLVVLGGVGRCLVVLVGGVWWCWLVVVGGGWWWLVVFGGGWWWLVVVGGVWWCVVVLGGSGDPCDLQGMRCPTAWITASIDPTAKNHSQ